VAPAVTLSAVTATDNTALAGGLAFTDSLLPIAAPTYDAASVISNNNASAMGPLIASAPIGFNVSAPPLVRSGASLGLAVTLFDAFDQAVDSWPGVTATLISSDASALSGPALVGYADGAAVFSTTTIRGPVASAYVLTATVASTSLSAAVTGGSGNASVTIAPCLSNEVFQASSSLCVCEAGYAPDASTLLCTACPAGFSASSSGSSTCDVCASGSVSAAGAAACTTCPPNSLSINNVCACSVGFYDALFGASSVAPVCTSCPDGAECTTGNVGAAEGYWRETPTDTVFMACREGACLLEIVTGALVSSGAAVNTTNATRRRQLFELDAAGFSATNCAEGSTGPLCGLCLPGYSLQSGACQACDPGDAFDNWPSGLKGALYAGVIALALIATPFLFFQPLSPALERTAAAAAGLAAATASRAKDGAQRCITCACCRRREKVDAIEVVEAVEVVEAAAKPGESDAEHAPATEVADAAAMPPPAPPGDDAPELQEVPPAAAGGEDDVEAHQTAPPLQTPALRRHSSSKIKHHDPALHHHAAQHTGGAVDDARRQAAQFIVAEQVLHSAGMMSAAYMQSGGGSDSDDDGADGGIGGGGDRGAIDNTMDMMDHITRVLERLQKLAKIVVKCVRLCPASLLGCTQHRAVRALSSASNVVLTCASPKTRHAASAAFTRL
jgi:hypothetical protein